MSQSAGVLDLPFEAEADLSALQYKFMTLGTAAGTVKKCGTADVPIGVLQNAPGILGAAVVRVLGTSKMISQSSFSKGDQLCVADANGGVDTVGAAPANICAIALEAAGAGAIVVEGLINRAFVAASIAPAALTAACTESQMLEYHTSGDIVATVTSKVLAITKNAGVIDVAGFRLGNTGTDASNALSLELDILIGGVSIFTTKPAISKTAADGLDTFTAGTGITVGAINVAANIFAAKAVITMTLTITRTASPSDELDTADVFAYLTEKVGA